jgi:hypothetical protein
MIDLRVLEQKGSVWKAAYSYERIKVGSDRDKNARTGTYQEAGCLPW